MKKRCIMLFFKPKKPDEDELLPPPPPFPSLDIEEASEKSTDEAEKSNEILSSEFNDLFNDLEADSRQEKKAKRIKQKPQKKLKEKGKPRDIQKEFPKVDESFDFPKESELSFGFEDERKSDDFKEEETKPKELLEAESEISSAIESMKKQQKPSLFRRLFAKKREVHEASRPEYAKADDWRAPGHQDAVGTPKIQDMINNARQALMNLDLESARKNYIESIKIYNTLSPEEKSRFYQDLKELYLERKNAEGLKV